MKVCPWFAAGILAGVISAADKPSPPYPGLDRLDPRKKIVAVIGDTQHTTILEFWRERNFRKTGLLFAEIARREPAFILHLGDLTAWGSRRVHWSFFDDYTRAIRHQGVPILPVLGNHDYYGDNRTALLNFEAHFPDLNARQGYSFVFRQVGFILFNSSFEDLSAAESARQREWYLRELARMEADAAIRFIVVAAHYPPFTNSRVVNASPQVRKLFAAPFEQTAKGAFFFSGHCHSYEKFLIGGKYFIVSGGGGGPRHALDIDPGRRAWDDRYEGPAMRFLHFAELEISADGLTLRIVRLNDNGSFSVADTVFFPEKKL